MPGTFAGFIDRRRRQFDLAAEQSALGVDFLFPDFGAEQRLLAVGASGPVCEKPKPILIGSAPTADRPPELRRAGLRRGNGAIRYVSSSSLSSDCCSARGGCFDAIAGSCDQP